MSDLFKDAEVEQYNCDGYIIIKGLFDVEEMEILRTAAKNDRAIEQNARALKDSEGGVQRMTLWNKAGDDLYGLVARTHCIVDRMEDLVGGEVYHYHSKMSIKEPYTGGAWSFMFHRGRSQHAGQRLPAGHPGLTRDRPHRAWSLRRSDQRRSRAG